MFHRVVQHHLNACDISTLACNKYDLSEYEVKIMFIIDIARTDTF